MDSFKMRLFWSVVFVILLADLSSQEFGDWFGDNDNENVVTSEDSSIVEPTMTKILSSTRSEGLTSSSTTTITPSAKTSLPSSTTSTTQSPTPSSTSTTIPSTTSSTTTTSTPSSTILSTSPSTTSSTVRTKPSTLYTSIETITSSTTLRPSTDPTLETSSKKKPIECLKIDLNAKIIFKYKSKEGFDQQFEIIGGNTNGELIQPNKCSRNQTLTIKYDLVENTQLMLGISITNTDISITRIRFEYPFHRLPDDFNKDNHSEEVQTCSADNRLNTKCLITEINNLYHYSLKYKPEDHIYCKELPLILLKNNKTSIDILLKDFEIAITDSQTNENINGSQINEEYCPLNTINDDGLDGMFAGSTKIWVGVSYAVVGALIMFGFAFIYEKFIREKLLYKPIDREEPQV